MTEWIVIVLITLVNVFAGFVLGVYAAFRFIIKEAPGAVPYIDKAFEKE